MKHTLYTTAILAVWRQRICRQWSQLPTIWRLRRRWFKRTHSSISSPMHLSAKGGRGFPETQSHYWRQFLQCGETLGHSGRTRGIAVSLCLYAARRHYRPYRRILSRQCEGEQQARQQMAWGKNVPELLFRHFVLPVRVNNEELDDARSVFYDELKDRIAGLSMRDAILEINHWCHEKVTYQPSDPRTSSPLATVRSAYGRCGEESTLLVAALRAMGIPARQVYTPRWAHTDDNHAWWKHGQTENGISSEPANRNRCSISDGSTLLHPGPC